VKNYVSQLNTIQDLLEVKPEQDSYEWLVDPEIIGFLKDYFEDEPTAKCLSVFSSLKKVTEVIFGPGDGNADVSGEDWVFLGGVR